MLNPVLAAAVIGAWGLADVAAGQGAVPHPAEEPLRIQLTAIARRSPLSGCAKSLDCRVRTWLLEILGSAEVQSWAARHRGGLRNLIRRTAADVRHLSRAYNDWLAEFCRTDPARLKGIATINLGGVEDGIRELERAARLGLAGAMITEYPAEDRPYDQPEYERFWAAAARLDAGRGHFDRVPLRGR